MAIDLENNGVAVRNPLGPEWLRNNPDITNIRVAACDLNGVWRGKRVPSSQLDKVLAGTMRMPVSALSLDIWGRDIEESPLVFETGDRDGYLKPTGRGLLPMDWVEKPSAMLPVWMSLEDGAPSPVDARQILAQAVERAGGMGFRAVMAIELEFYLIDPRGDRPASPISPLTGKRLSSDSILSVDEIDQFDGFFSEVYAACAVQGIDVDTAISEAGRGQFEINLVHCDDPLKAADDAALFKRIVKGIARTDELAASFMSKPFADRSGSGMHVHFSLIDSEGRNVFDNGSSEGAPLMHHAIAGLLGTMHETSLIWAPHLNSYRRLQRGTHAPNGLCWGYENRTAAIRVPGGPASARRIEHRVAGADANPYLVLASILHGALSGIERIAEPVDPITGDAYTQDLERLPRRWSQAITAFENSGLIRDHFPPLFAEIYAKTKWQEQDGFASRISDFEIETYLESV